MYQSSFLDLCRVTLPLRHIIQQNTIQECYPRLHLNLRTGLGVGERLYRSYCRRWDLINAWLCWHANPVSTCTSSLFIDLCNPSLQLLMKPWEIVCWVIYTRTVGMVPDEPSFCTPEGYESLVLVLRIVSFMLS